MKKYHLIPLLLLVGIFLFGCGSKEKKVETSTFQPMEVQIPDALKDNPEAVEYIENMSKAVDAYAMALDKLAAEKMDTLLLQRPESQDKNDGPE